MTNEERLQLVQSIELKQRHIFLSISAVLALVIVLGISYYGSRMIQQRRAEAASARAIAAQQETVDAPAAEVLTLSSQGQSIISGASASARQLIQAAEARKAAQEAAAQQEAKGKEAAVIPEGFVLREMTADDVHKGELQLINKTYEYHFLEDDLLSLIYDPEGGNYYLSSFQIQMTKNTADALHQLLGAFYAETGYENILVLNGYRSKEEADALYAEDSENRGDEYADSHTMTAGHSEHHSGMATDLGYFSTGSFIEQGDEELSWFYEHACDYGFILRYPEDKQAITQIALEDWHFRYVGVPAATDIYRQQLCLEEWIDLIHQHTVQNPYEITVGENTYVLYYASGEPNAETGKIEVPVPEGKNVVISGDNIEGFIVTVQP